MIPSVLKYLLAFLSVGELADILERMSMLSDCGVTTLR